MITKWTTLDPLNDNTTTFRFWCDDEETDLDIAQYFVRKYVGSFGYRSAGLIKIKYDKDNVFYEIITTLPFNIFQKNNDFFEFIAVSDREIQGVKNK